MEERDGSGSVCATASVATHCRRLQFSRCSSSPPIATLSVTSLIAASPLEAIWYLHRDLDFAAGRPAVLARTQS
eukprot:6195299-Pleurochrysis_carterae.AAC.1